MTLRQTFTLFVAALVVGAATSGCGTANALAVGSMAPDLKVHPALEPAKTVGLSDLKGKVVIVDFWATWCGPCRMMLPHIQKLWDDNKNKGLEVMAITAESSAKVVGFETQNKYDFPVYTDESRDANNAYNITGLPTTLVVGKDGKIVYFTMGMDDNTPAEIETAVTNALK